jgi:hypothetical protein
MADALTEAAEALYRLPPEGFVAARDAEVSRLRGDGDREGATGVAGLRRPTVSAWLVNLLVADDPDLAGRLTELAGQLAAAQQELAGEELRELGRQRQRLVSGLVDRARTLARGQDRSVPADVLAEVEATLRAALADPAVAAQVLSGRLTRAASFTGFGPAAAAAPVAPAGPRRTARPAPPRTADRQPTVGRRGGRQRADGQRAEQQRAEQQRAEQQRVEQERVEQRAAEQRAAEQRLRETQEALADAAADRSAARRDHATAGDTLAAAHERLAWLQAQLRQAEADRERAEERRRAAKEALDAAGAAWSAAKEAVAAARKDLRRRH